MDPRLQQEPLRLGFHEVLDTTPLPVEYDAQGRTIRRFVSRQPAWKPGEDLPWERLQGPIPVHRGPGSYGGHVYAQASLCAARAIQADGDDGDGDGPDAANGTAKGGFAIHTIQGVFTAPGLKDRPFVYQVTPLSDGRSFSSRIVTARQPSRPSRSPSGPFPASDGDLPLGDVCFSSITTFKRPHATVDEVGPAQSAQDTYAAILSTRAPHEWELSPQSDVDAVKELFPNPGPGTFPILDMHKVDMTGFNAGKPIDERRELIYYRPLKPLDRHDVNAHILCHAFEADRNGLIMCGNHLGYGHNLGRAASLSYSFYVHVNPEETLLDTRRWWLQEVCWPRVSAGRTMMESRLWSPDGRHIASGYQDGIIQPDKSAGRRGRL